MVELRDTETLKTVRSLARGYNTPEHAHGDHGMLLLPLVSPMTVCDRESVAQRPLEPRFFYFVDAGLPHATRSDRRRQEHIAVYLGADWLRFALGQAGLPRELRHRSGIWRLTDTALDLARIVAREARRADADSRRLLRLSELLAEECLCRIQTTEAVSGSHPRSHGTALIVEAVECLREDLAEPPTLDELAERLGVSRRHLTRTFRSGTGQSIGEYLRQERFREARRLLAETGWSIQQIACMVGMDNAANFASSFRREVGMAPAQYRRLHGRGPAPKAN